MTAQTIQLQAGADTRWQTCRPSTAVGRVRLRAWAEVLVVIALSLTALLGVVTLGSIGVDETPAGGPTPGLGL